MKIMATFKCSKCKSSEELRVDSDTEVIDCNECGGESVRQLSAPKYFGNSTGRSPSAVN